VSRWQVLCAVNMRELAWWRTRRSGRADCREQGKCGVRVRVDFERIPRGGDYDVNHGATSGRTVATLA
jgi:hypothetical protein